MFRIGNRMHMPGIRIAALAACFAVLIPFGSAAQELINRDDGKRPTVVELFTSQGCPQCPPADAFFETLADRDDVIALAWHVDYWDYIGWPDQFASPACTARQKGYARANGARSIYTPQLVVGGSRFIGGAPAMLAADYNLDRGGDRGGPGVQIARDGDYVTVHLAPGPTMTAGQAGTNADAALAGGVMADVSLVRYIPEATVEIERGENAGKTIRYRNIVTEWTSLGTWDGEKAVTMGTHVMGDLPLVVIVQAAGYGPIIAAAALR